MKPFPKEEGIIPLLIMVIIFPPECSGTVLDASRDNNTDSPANIFTYHVTTYNNLPSATCDATMACQHIACAMV